MNFPGLTVQRAGPDSGPGPRVDDEKLLRDLPG
jgi:hypothetical protein